MSTEYEIVRDLLVQLQMVDSCREEDYDSDAESFVEELHKAGYKIVRALDTPHNAMITGRTITGQVTTLLCDCGRKFSDPIHFP